jgi:DNA-directed RNA polymerase subunit omega
MLNPDLKGILNQGISRYSLVIAAAKRAREIAVQNLEEKNLSTEKPVTVALGEIIDGKYKIVEPDSIKNL